MNMSNYGIFREHLKEHTTIGMKKKYFQGGHVTDWKQALLRRRGLTVLGVCVAACVLAVCVATVVVVVELASKRSLVLFDAELMVRGGSAERETEDRVSFHSGEKSPDLMTNGLIGIETQTRKHKK